MPPASRSVAYAPGSWSATRTTCEHAEALLLLHQNSAHDVCLDVQNTLSLLSATLLKCRDMPAVRPRSCLDRLTTSTSTFRTMKRSRSSQPASVRGWTQHSRTGDSQRDRPADLTSTPDRARTTLAQRCTCLLDCSDATLDAETAWALGFTPATLTAEEEDLLPGDADEGVYCRVGTLPKPFGRVSLWHDPAVLVRAGPC